MTSIITVINAIIVTMGVVTISFMIYILLKIIKRDLKDKEDKHEEPGIPIGKNVREEQKEIEEVIELEKPCQSSSTSSNKFWSKERWHKKHETREKLESLLHSEKSDKVQKTSSRGLSDKFWEKNYLHKKENIEKDKSFLEKPSQRL